ncbi:DoxX family protein [Pullulanibacillus sp. KACC 23026]|uniref:DoxX family membrane protein n=1 Tax=Pullulanibacillus sp. KACC 23026 TaxID=3028315 RepID=UPI0023AF5453|nr:DoxX family protein [Pullulanibacillus sp. KACC 23026]WEG14765.1 DoxX family protein [Pullulanibacillus sp. KACC 23026]
MRNHEVVIPENPVSHFLFVSTRFAWFWLIVRLYVGYQWLSAGWGKLHEDVWTGGKAGVALTGFIQGALVKSKAVPGSNPDVAGWYANFLKDVVLPHAKLFSYLVSYGEFLVGLGLIVGLLTGIAAFFGGLMNASYLFAGTLSTNPILLILGMILVLAWKVAGWYGLDRFALPFLGTPWKRNEQTLILHKNTKEN